LAALATTGMMSAANRMGAANFVSIAVPHIWI
jgi:hypothetical protein